MDRVDRVVHSIYDAALDDTLWPRVLTELSDACGSVCSHMIVFRRRSADPVFGFIGRYPQEAHDEYALHYVDRDVRSTRLLASVPLDAAVTDDLLISESERRRCPVHQEFLLKYEVDRMLVQGFTLSDSTKVGLLAVFRSSQAGGYEARDIQALGRLTPHAQRALEISGHLGGLQRRVQNLEEALNQLPFGVLLADSTGNLLFESTMAEDLLRRGDGLRMINGRLTAVFDSEAARLTRRIRQASHRASIPSASGMSVSRNTGRRPYQLMVAPLPRNHFWPIAAGAEVVLILSDPELAAPSLAETLSAIYQLTPAEAQLAVGLLDGGSLQDYADRHGITRETAKSQLKSVFSRTDCRRQSELVGLIARVPTPVADAEPPTSPSPARDGGR